MPSKILVVDDESDWEDIIKQAFMDQILDGTWEFIFTANGREALDQITTHSDIAVILLDIYMPVMDGFTFLEEFNKLGNPGIKVLVITAFDNMTNLRRAMNLGAFDFLIKPVDLADLEKTIVKSLDEARVYKELLAHKQEKETLERELEVAANIQKAMLPVSFPQPPNLHIHAQMLPAKKIGGDFYDLFFLDEDNTRLAFFIGDVSGKGIPAALYMAKCCTLLKAVASHIQEPAACLRKVNDLLIPETEKKTYVTVLYGVIHTVTGEIHYSCGGHPAPIIVRADGTVTTLHHGKGILGKYKEKEFPSWQAQLKNGDTLFLYTDGVTDAKNARDEHLMEDGLMNYLKETAALPLEQVAKGLMEKIRAFALDEPQFDDITTLMFRFHAGE